MDTNLAQGTRVQRNLLNVFLFPFFMVFALAACESKQEPWNPVFEDTSFRYLDTAVGLAVGELDRLEENLSPGNNLDPKESLARTRQRLLALRKYYIPLTEVREMINDADRFFRLGRLDGSAQRLKDARLLIESIRDASSSEGLNRELEEVNVMLDDCVLSITQNRAAAYEQFEKLGTRVNLMLVKGELVVSGVGFH